MYFQIYNHFKVLLSIIRNLAFSLLDNDTINTIYYNNPPFRTDIDGAWKYTRLMRLEGIMCVSG